MTFSTVRDLTMFLMAVGTCYLTMLTRGVAPGGKDIFVTGAAGLGIVRAVSDFQRFMNRMAGQAFSNLLTR